MDTRLRSLLEDICEHAMRMKDQWNCWDIEERHGATNELHARAQAADAALMDAVRLTDFTEPSTADHTSDAERASDHLAEAPARAS